MVYCCRININSTYVMGVKLRDTNAQSGARTRRRQHPIQVMVPADLENELMAEAERAGVSRSEFVRVACEEYVSRVRAEREAAARRTALLAARGALSNAPGGSDVFVAARAADTRNEDADVRP